MFLRHNRNPFESTRLTCNKWPLSNRGEATIYARTLFLFSAHVVQMRAMYVLIQSIMILRLTAQFVLLSHVNVESTISSFPFLLFQEKSVRVVALYKVFFTLYIFVTEL